MPIVYIPHGGGPIPLLETPEDNNITKLLSGLSAKLPEPEAILVISAHWEESKPAILGGASPGMLYDYYGFPPETYKYQYPAPGCPKLALQLSEKLKTAIGDCDITEDRGYDHGVFVPLMLMYPEAKIPVFQLSLLSSLDAGKHLAIGEALKSLRQQGVLIIGSGFSFHNLQGILSEQSDNDRDNAIAFDHWLVNTVTDAGLHEQSRKIKLQHWEQAPSARFCHPREEHLLPLHVCAGAAGYQAADLLFHEEVYETMISGFIWSE